jgi:dimethylargininase
MTVKIAIIRGVSPAIGACELTYQERRPIDFALAAQQHAEYERVLEKLGCTLRRLPAEPDLPDSVFVEDAAIVLDELAVITRPGAESRRPETHSIAHVLRYYRKLESIQAPGTLDGGDVLCVGKRLFVGLSHRTNEAAIGQLRSMVAGFGYEVAAVPVGGCLHLKSAATQVGPDTLLINRDWIDAGAFDAVRFIDVDPAEPAGANALLIGEAVVYPSAFPKTRRRLESLGIAVDAVEASELAKAEGGVTCCSLVFCH